jgi:hypothetical protein
MKSSPLLVAAIGALLSTQAHAARAETAQYCKIPATVTSVQHTPSRHARTNTNSQASVHNRAGSGIAQTIPSACAACPLVPTCYPT